MNIGLLGAVLLAAAPAPPERAADVERGASAAPDGGAAATSDGGPADDGGGAAAAGVDETLRAEAALGRGDPASLEEAARGFETAALMSAEPGVPWLRAARIRRGLAETASLGAAAQRGGAAAPQLEQATRESQACSDDARRAWRQAAPEAAAAQAARSSAEVAALVPAPVAEALYLDAVCASLWARAQGITPLLDRAAELRAFFGRAALLAPALDDAGPSRELGRLLAAIPAYAGGDLELARAHFEAALKAAPSVRTRVAYAESVAVSLQDRKLFEALLAPVIAVPDDRSALADKARALLQRADELFGKAH